MQLFTRTRQFSQVSGMANCYFFNQILIKTGQSFFEGKVLTRLLLWEYFGQSTTSTLTNEQSKTQCSHDYRNQADFGHMLSWVSLLFSQLAISSHGPRPPELTTWSHCFLLILSLTHLSPIIDGAPVKWHARQQSAPVRWELCPGTGQIEENQKRLFVCRHFPDPVLLAI